MGQVELLRYGTKRKKTRRSHDIGWLGGTAKKTAKEFEGPYRHRMLAWSGEGLGGRSDFVAWLRSIFSRVVFAGGDASSLTASDQLGIVPERSKRRGPR